MAGFVQSFAVATVGGYLASDPKVFLTKKGRGEKSGGRKLVKFCVAVNNIYRTGRQETAWLDFIAWGNKGEFVEKYLRKGMRVVVIGVPKTNTWVDNDGNKRKDTYIEADKIIIFAKKGERIADDTSEEVKIIEGENEENEDDVPF